MPTTGWVVEDERLGKGHSRELGWRQPGQCDYIPSCVLAASIYLCASPHLQRNAFTVVLISIVHSFQPYHRRVSLSPSFGDFPLWLHLSGWIIPMLICRSPWMPSSRPLIEVTSKEGSCSWSPPMDLERCTFTVLRWHMQLELTHLMDRR
jgi:hypothetical protein